MFFILLISELLFNPLPGGADYLELYNPNDTVVHLDHLRLAKMSGDSIVKFYPISANDSVLPHSYIVLSSDPDYVKSNYTVPHPAQLIRVPSMPSYNDDAGIVALFSSDTVLVDRFDYNAKMHSPLIRDLEGVALERRSFSQPTNNASNWYSAASAAGYGTPTAPNSQSHEFLFVDDDFSTDKTLFSPDGDGYDDLLDITYSLQHCDLACNITIFDSHGRLVRTLARGLLLGCSGTLVWDGTDDNRQACQRGNYIVIIDAYNEKGTRQVRRLRVSLVYR